MLLFLVVFAICFVNVRFAQAAPLSRSDLCQSILSTAVATSNNSSNSNVIADFSYGSYSSSSSSPSICSSDARYLLNNIAPTIYKALTLANASSNCARDLALLFCIVLLPPTNTNSQVCQSSCLNVFSLTQGSCSAIYAPPPSLTAISFIAPTTATSSSSSSSSSSSPTLIDLITTMLPPFAHRLMNCSDNQIYTKDNNSNSNNNAYLNTTALQSCRNGALYSSNNIIQPPMPTCSPYASSSLHPLFNGSVCRDVINYDIYIPADVDGPQSSFTFSEIEMLSLSLLFPAASLANGCRQSFARLVCASIFPKCDTQAFGRALPASPFRSLAIPYPSYPCQSLCLTADSQCSDMYASVRSTIANFLPPTSTFPIFVLLSCSYAGDFVYGYRSCDGVVNVPAQQDRPNATTVVGVLSSSANAGINSGNNVVYVTSECNNVTLATGPTTPISQAVVAVQCPYPLVIPDDPATATILNGACALPCPMLLWTSSEWITHGKILTASTVVSSITLTPLAVTWVIFPSKRKNESLMNFFLLQFVFFTLLSFGTLASPSYDRSRLGCLDNSKYVTQSDGGWCPFEGAVVTTLPLMGVLWWLIICVDLFIKIVIDRVLTTAEKQIQKIINRLVGWGIPTVFLVVGLSKGLYGRTFSLAFCFIADRPDRVFFEYALLYFPILLSLFTGTVLMILILVTIARSSLRTKSKKRSNSRWWAQYARPVIFIVIFDAVFSLLAGFRVSSDVYNQEYTDSIAWFVSCLLTLGPGCPLQHPTYRPSLSFVYFIYVFVFGQGALWLIVFGTQKDNFKLWSNLLHGMGVMSSGASASSQMQKPTRDRPSGRSSRNLHRDVASNPRRDKSLDLSSLQMVSVPASEKARSESHESIAQTQGGITSTIARPVASVNSNTDNDHDRDRDRDHERDRARDHARASGLITDLLSPPNPSSPSLVPFAPASSSSSSSSPRPSRPPVSLISSTTSLGKVTQVQLPSRDRDRPASPRSSILVLKLEDNDATKTDAAIAMVPTSGSRQRSGSANDDHDPRPRNYI